MNSGHGAGNICGHSITGLVARIVRFVLRHRGRRREQEADRRAGKRETHRGGPYSFYSIHVHPFALAQCVEVRGNIVCLFICES